MFNGNLEILSSFQSVSQANSTFFSRSNKLDQLFTEYDYTSLFSSTQYFSADLVEIFTFDSLVSDIEKLSNSKNDVDLMCQIFPSYEDIICELDMWSRYGEETLQYVDSTPDLKLYYPEPFIASPSFVHEELWFIHILHYQHWLWFMFISLVMFYFITFINVVRWCNLRTKPKRETRGVSRSKCADLITACVPVSWAASIIISETVDATDYYDGFGTGEIVVGIRAYQWGWEYFYPKGIDLNYNVKPSYSEMVGNSLKYNNSSSTNTETNSVWKSYQNKNLQSLSNSPSHVLISPMGKDSSINFTNYSKVGLSTLKDSSAFKKIQYHSKVNPQSLYSDSSNYSQRYNKLFSLYLSSNSLNESYNYGTFRQHGYSNLSSTTNQYALESKSVDKLLDYNYNVDHKSTNLKYSNALPSPAAASDSSYIFNYLSETSAGNALNHQSYLNNRYTISSTSDGRSYTNPFKYYLGKPSNTTNGSSSDLPRINDINSPADNKSNASSSYKFKDLKSANLNFLSADKNVRNLDQFSLSKPNFNFMSSNNNLSSIVANTIDSSKDSSTNELALYGASSSDWSNTEASKTLMASQLTLTPSHTPIYSNESSWTDMSFDRYQEGFEDVPPTLLKSKEETAPTYLFSAYWNSSWANTKTAHRFSNLPNMGYFSSQMYLPAITEYSDYDFKNWEALEMLEDAFWESTFSSFSQDEYLNILQSNAEYLLFKKQEELFNLSTRSKKFKNAMHYKPFNKSLASMLVDNSISNSLPIYTEDAVLPTNLIARNNFSTVPLEPAVDLMDESLDSIKSHKYVHFNNHLNTFYSSTMGLSSLSYTAVLDPFRADYEDVVWTYDNLDNASDLGEEESLQQDLKSSNTMKLRSTARNAIVTYNAIQKVFKSRLDEGRSHSRLQDFSNSYVAHPFVTASKSPYEGMLAKNKESFFSVQSYNHFNNANFNTLFSVWNSLNSTYLDIPFLISAISDSSRYLWFDWQSRWSSIEVQPSSVARYSLSGVPYFNKSYEYDTQKGDELNESENYINRLARARKNYMPNWAHTPYFYARVSNWYKFNNTLYSSYNELDSTKLLLSESYAYWNSTNFSVNLSNAFTPSISGVNTPAKASWRPLSGIQGYYGNSAQLVDILTKREFLYRSYFNAKGFTANLPSYLTASPNNSLLLEVQKGYNLVDPVTFSSEISRELTYQDLNFMRFSLFKDALASTGVNTSFITNYLFYYLGLDTSIDKQLGANQGLLKDQYRPMKKGITNMIRLHTTGAIAMPIEIRLHILASSRDVIHSWAIPSAGIKIDCVPGYSSHRVTIFLVSGIFWGQCMEICGRFHHWMPIVVYFMKRDLFFLWCTHFMHYSSVTDMFDTTDKQLADKLRLASFDKTSWVNEINKIF
jgi:heme/copper-type cytochrome/quinol oxidase subunit 2